MLQDPSIIGRACPAGQFDGAVPEIGFSDAAGAQSGVRFAALITFVHLAI